jgi:glycosyltransferase involved in cell wall biosynthesis
MGGEDTVVESEVNLMRSKGHEVRLLMFDNASMGEGIAGKIRTGISSIYNYSSATLLRETVKEFTPGIIHVHNFFFTASPSVLIEAAKLKIPLVVTIHNFRLICASAHLLRDGKICELCVPHQFPWYGVKYKCYHHSAVQSAVVGSIAAVHKITGTWKNKVHRYITPAEFSRKRLVDSSFKVPGNKISVKRNFIADPGTGKATRENFYLFVGRLSIEKGVQVMLEAWKDIPEKKLLVAGDGPESEKLKLQYGHLPNVEFAGRIDRQEILSLMKRCKALIFPSIWYEGLPMTIVEAFATGTPVIASAIGSMNEMIDDGKNGLLFEAGNSHDLINHLNEFESLPSNNFSNYARESYLEKYHPDKCYESVMKIYSEVING